VIPSGEVARENYQTKFEDQLEVDVPKGYLSTGGDRWSQALFNAESSSPVVQP
jgi:hypothetical protein